MNEKKNDDGSSFSKLNVENLFSSKRGKKLQSKGKLDIKTLFRKQKNEDQSFDSSILLENITKRKKRLDEKYIEIFRLCRDKIIAANSAGITDILYEVPEFVPECQNYNSFESMNLIIEKLNDQQLSCMIINNRMIFISWHDLENKLISRYEIKEHDDCHTD
jgi:hypothetical protein